ncbi:hypothetical protein ROZALSC1DRAFT_30977, partial [Rozella allomycis CSF55]
MAKDGSIFFDFVDSYTRELFQLEDFQMYRQISGIIGIVHCPQFEDLGEAHERFNKITSKFPQIINKRCFAFEPREDQPDNSKNVIMIPNQDEQLSFYLSTMINDFTCSFLQTFGKLANSIEKKTLISSPMQLDVTITNEDQVKLKKRAPGRALKLVGDLNLLVGNIQGATQNYSMAIDAAKLGLDYIWQASAIEGILSANYLVAWREGDKEHLRERLEDFPERYKDVIMLYERGVAHLLASEACLNLARVLVELNSKAEAASILSKAWSFEGKMKMFKRAAFFLRQLALLLWKNGEGVLALSFMKKSLPYFHLPISSDSIVLKGWPMVQKIVCKEVLTISESTKSPDLIQFFTTLFLRKMNKYMSSSEQSLMFNSLKKLCLSNKKENNRKNSIKILNENVSLVDVNKIQIIPNLNSSYPKQMKKEKIEKKDQLTFLFNPFEKSKQNNNCLIMNESFMFEILINNPMSFPIEIQSISLINNENAFLTDSISVIIPPNSFNYQIKISVKPIKTGKLKILGLNLKIMDSESQHFIDEFGNKSIFNDKGIQLNVIEAQPLLKMTRNSLLNDSLMLFEGEKQEVSLSLENIGTIPVDYFQIKFNPLFKESIENNYELEYYASNRPEFIHDNNNINFPILPFKDPINIKFLVHGSFLCKGFPKCLECVHFDIIKYTSSEWDDHLGSQDSLDSLNNAQNYCLLALDIHNNWDCSISLKFNLPGSLKPGTSDITAHSTKRIILPTSKLFLQQEIHQSPLPLLNKRQYVVPKGPKLSQAQKHLLDQINIQWKMNQYHKGSLYLDNINLSKRNLSILLKDSMLLDIFADPVHKERQCHLECQSWSKVRLFASVQNLTESSLRCCLRILPVEIVNHEYENLQRNGKFSFLSPQQQILPVIHGNQDYTVPIDIVENLENKQSIWLDEPFKII